MKPRVEFVVAMDLGGCIGDGAKLPWRLSADFARFKRLTLGRTIAMGRKTFDSIGRPLPHRQSIVLTRNLQWKGLGWTDACHTVNSPRDALKVAANEEVLMVIGGAEVYWAFAPLVSVIHMTIVETHARGDIFFPKMLREYEIVLEERVGPDEKNAYPMRFERWTLK